MDMIVDWLIDTLSQVNIFTFSLIGPFLEEIVAPIPSPLIFGTIGTIAYVKSLTLWMIALLNFIGSVSKTVASVIIYFVVHKFEDIVSHRFGKFLGWNHETIEKLGSNFGKGLKGFFILTFLRALPIMPSSVISLASGFFRVPLGLFVIATLIGNFIRNSFLIYLGFLGLENLSFLQSGIHSLESKLTFLLLGISIVGFYAFRFYKEKKSSKKI